jgi:hypothetical protein
MTKSEEMEDGRKKKRMIWEEVCKRTKAREAYGEVTVGNGGVGAGAGGGQLDEKGEGGEGEEELHHLVGVAVAYNPSVCLRLWPFPSFLSGANRKARTRRLANSLSIIAILENRLLFRC